MNPSQSSSSNRFRVGLFTVAGLIAIVLITVYVNDKPYWWRPCQLVRINVEDATGLKTKSPIRSLGIEIGYLESVELTETHVTLGICITAPVEVLPSTRAYIRSEGFLGDKFVELKPVRYVGSPGPTSVDSDRATPTPPGQGSGQPAQTSLLDQPGHTPRRDSGDQPGHAPRRDSGDQPGHMPRRDYFDWILPEAWADESAYAANPPPVDVVSEGQPAPVSTPAVVNSKSFSKKGGREIPVAGGSEDVQHLVNRVDDLVNEMTHLTTNLKSAINPEELRETMRQLNKTLENASRTLSPEGGLNQTAQRTLAKLEDAIEQLRDQLTRINQGKGSVGMLLNDPSYAEAIRQAIENLNKLLNKVNNVVFVVNIGAVEITGYNSSRAWFQLAIWPNPSRYYLLGIAVDPRGALTQTTSQTVTNAGGVSTTVNTNQTTTSPTGLLFTAMLGKLFFDDRLDAAVGALYGDGALSLGIRLGPLNEANKTELVRLQNDIYSRTGENGLNDRVTLAYRPYASIYVEAGLETIHRVNGAMAWFGGAGLKFDDEDIKLLFALR